MVNGWSASSRASGSAATQCGLGSTTMHHSQRSQQPELEPTKRTCSRFKFQQLQDIRQAFLSRRPSESIPSSVKLTHLTFAGGLVFSSALAIQFMPALAWLSPSKDIRPLQEKLWQSVGSVRQSVASLEQAQRALLTASVQAEVDTPPAASSGTAESQAPSVQPKAINSKPSTPEITRPESTIDANLEMRVAIAKSSTSLDIGVSTEGYVMDLDGQNYCNLPAQAGLVATINAQGIDFSGCQLSGAVWLESAGELIYVGNSWYKGRVLLINEGDRLLAVNFVFLHDYLSSVVGSEMYVYWPIEALKAQAVAARSYALTHHVRYADRHYDLDNTERYQAYLGVAKETNTTQQAVYETSGEFISYDGGIVESLYAASEQIVQEAHGGQGMSQTGAMEMAAAGYTYLEILTTYYPNTGLSRLIVE